jgi:protein-disulfide isomerase
MNRKKTTVAVLALVVFTFFVLGMRLYQQRVQGAQAQKVGQQGERLVRPHAPTLGPASAPVTIVEFFDPACETCRAFYPIVKDILKQHPEQVRLVVRYAPFHAGSDQVVLLLEAARLQDRYLPVLEMLLAGQPLWADHGQPRLDLAERLAQEAGLDIERARADARRPELQAALRQDIEDLTALEVTRTPTFFVNGRSLPSFGEGPLRGLVEEAVAQARAGR